MDEELFDLLGFNMDDLGEPDVPAGAESKPAPVGETPLDTDLLMGGMDDLGEPDVPAGAESKPAPLEETPLDADLLMGNMDDLGEPDVPAGVEPQSAPVEETPFDADLLMGGMDDLGEPDVPAGAEPQSAPVEETPLDEDFLMDGSDAPVITDVPKNSAEQMEDFLLSPVSQPMLQPEGKGSGVEEAPPLSDQDFIRMPETKKTASADLMNSAIAEQKLRFFDPDEVEGEVTAEMSYCMLMCNTALVQKSEVWQNACEALYPQDPIQAVKEFVAGHEKAFMAPKVVTFSKSWTIADLLGEESVHQEAVRVSAYLWKDVIQHADGTESPQWIATVWAEKMMQHLTNYFLITLQ